MKCRKVAKELPAYIANELSERARSRVEKHLKHCVLCTAELGALKRTDQLLDTLGDVEPRRDLVGLVMRHIEREQETIPAFKRFLISLRERRPQLQYAAANILIVVLLALGIYRYQAWRARPSQRSLANVSGVPVVADRGNAQWRGPFGRIGKLVIVSKSPAPRAVAENADIKIPLSEGDVQWLNSDLELARTDTRASEPRDGAPSLLPSLRAVEAPGAGPSVILSPGPDGTLIIRPGTEEPAPPAE